MNTALAAMKSKSINCSFSTDALLNHIGRMAAEISYRELMQEFDSEKSLVMHCVEVVYCHYIFDSLELLENDASRPMSRDGYFRILKNSRVIQR
jgi:hypothetical protein